MNLIYTYKDPSSNTVTFLISFQPVSPKLSNISNYSNLLSCNLPNTTFKYSYDPPSGHLTVIA